MKNKKSNTEYYIDVYETKEEMQQEIYNRITGGTLHNIIHIGDPLEDLDVNKIKKITNCTSKKTYTMKINEMTGGSKYCIIYKKIKSKKYLKRLNLLPNQLK